MLIKLGGRRTFSFQYHVLEEIFYGVTVY